ncbi:hypothetical protein SPRG_01999 [Saprolegnia parasitica CBS 223.65]|uniref:Uncharacterized protein n=1 Tax=Saprolegnia parasitica (strain CBS 223.65) TaxID=695850 RepID=A0A067D2G5_SAPPC|nr:hypothetical protein SPRG_01999 [Saprolegnia parasitica CBS 223.65]KDO33187.1 hypothetical protein SPRG_01999 [Saprolegnia parasitica CBS 223.65]|eukprot:XP_012195948.1 hypothetical protein SPRG_01999 [Saprolegnia parasitica CBS 223.65]
MFPTAELSTDGLEFHVHFDHAPDAGRLRSMAAEVAAFVGDYIWQKEPLCLEAPMTTWTSATTLLGKMYVGDNVEDEWVATAALLSLTKTHADMTLQVADADGQFLLIEAAEALPMWVTPENSNNRVFLRHGRVYLITDDVEKGHLDLAVALKSLTTTPSKYEAPRDAQRILGDRLEQARTHSMQRSINRHTVQCRVPTSAAIVLQETPRALAYAVEAFYYREPTEATRLCRHMQRFSPIAMTSVMVPFSRCMFAQLKQQPFAAPKPFGNLDEADDAAILGMKLTCGLELLYASSTKDHTGALWTSRIDAAATAPLQPAPLAPNDDDAWLYVAPESLEETLRKAESRVQDGNADELQDMASMFHSFVKEASEYDGVDMSAHTLPPVSLDMDALMAILNQTAATPSEKPHASDDNDAYFFSSDDDDSDDEDEEDQDDAAMDHLMEQLMDEMDMELTDSKMGKSFQTTTTTRSGVTDDAADLAPVNLDLNLVSNLLESLTSQEGQAGPVSNMLHDMGFRS